MRTRLALQLFVRVVGCGPLIGKLVGGEFAERGVRPTHVLINARSR